MSQRDPVENSRIFAKARELAKTKQLHGVETYSIFVGQPGCGKSSLLGLLQKDKKEYEPTLDLNYIFARKTNKKDSRLKDVAHVWELGRGIELEDLFDVVLRPGRPIGAVGVVVDLSKPVEAIGWARRWLNAIVVKRNITKNILLIGSKYDLFKSSTKLSAKEKSVLAKALRAIAWTHGASLYFLSTKDEIAFRNTLGSLLFRKPDKSSKPNSDIHADLPLLFIPSNTDTPETINGCDDEVDLRLKHPFAAPDPAAADEEIKQVSSSLDHFLRDAIVETWGAECVPERLFRDDDDDVIEGSDEYGGDDDYDEKFAEPVIDEFCKRKVDELNQLLAREAREKAAAAKRAAEDL